MSDLKIKVVCPVCKGKKGAKCSSCNGKMQTMSATVNPMGELWKLLKKIEKAVQ